jgi:ABC-type multidrug transport system ATPase subunit
MNGGPQPVIEVRGLWRFYGRRKKIEAVRDVSFHVGQGEIFGLIGPDGAGKTSIIQVLAGVLTAHKGSVRVEGVDVIADPEAVKDRVGYMPQGLGVNLYESLSVAENIEFFRDLRKLPAGIYETNRADLLKMTRLEPFVQRRVCDLSGGMRQKLALICTLIHLPDVILLDEPTTGVDPISRQEFWQIMRRLVQERKVTVLLSTSYMDEAERCHRIALIHAGAVIDQGDPGDLKAKATGQFARLVAKPQVDAVRVLQTRKDVSSTEVYGKEIRIQFEGDLVEIESGLVSRYIELHSVERREPSLEDFFIQLLSSGKQGMPSLQVSAQPEMRTSNVIEIAGATRKFGDFLAVDSVDLRVARGEIFGLLGPNGAGKTTLIKMMCGLLEPTAGTVRVAGIDVKTDRAHVWPQIGYMSQQFSLYRDLTVAQNLRLYSDLYNVRQADFTSMERSLGLEEFGSRLAGDLPTGVRQRLSLLCAMLHRPQVLFLDEPTSGVDPLARRNFWDLIYSLSRVSGVTVLVSTHYMDEADHCDRLGLMHRGRLFALDSPESLKRTSEERSGKLLAIHTHAFRDAFDALCPAYPGAFLFGDRIHLRSFDPRADEHQVFSLLLRAGISDARTSEPPLSMDETFIDFIRSAEMAHA